MGYVEADTSPKVGFRPYHQTDAEAASSLSGLGLYYRNRPFDPWELYPDAHHVDGLGDLGQNHPFQPEAWHLHGLGADPDVVVAKAVAELESAGQITQGEGDAILEGSMEFVDVLGYDPTDRSSWIDMVGTLRRWNSDLQSIESQVIAANNQRLQSGQQATPEFSALASQVNQQRQRFNSLSQQFVNVYRTVTGEVPSGLSGLGVIPLAAYVAGAAVLMAAVWYGHQAFETWKQSVNVSQIVAQTAQTTATTTAASSQSLLKIIADAQARGDTVTAQSALKALADIGKPPPQSQPAGTVEAWLMTNAKWIGLGAAGLIVLGPLSQGLFGKRR